MKISRMLNYAFLPCAFALFLFASCNAPQQEIAEANDSQGHQDRLEEIRKANDELYSGLNAMFNGDFEPLNKMWSHSEDITYMGPFGGVLTGWTQVQAEFLKVTDKKLGGKIRSENLHVYAGTDMGYTICVEVGENMSEDGTPIEVSHRATNIFRLEDGTWRLVHHHTDLAPQLEDEFKITEE